MTNDSKSEQKQYPFFKEEWPILFSLIIISILYPLLPDAISKIFPILTSAPLITRIVSISLSSILVLATVLGWVMQWVRFSRYVLISFAIIVTVYLISGVFLLGGSLFTLHGTAAAVTLLRDAIIVWVINILIFAVWFWLIDGGGRRKRHAHLPMKRDFLFTQEHSKIPGWENWQPNYMDYLFLSFCNCSTFGPTDTLVLSRRVKSLVMIQTMISLITLSMLITRAFSLV